MSSAQTLPTVFSGSSSTWAGSLYAFLAEKQRRSGSNRTPDSYYRTLRHFFGSLQKAPDQVSPQDVFSFAHGIGLSGREPSPVTVGARLSCISSFFKFLIRMDVLKANPCDPVERPKPRPSAPSGLSAIQVQQLLQVIPDTVKGRRDLAIVLTLVLTGRRRSEVINLTAGDIAFDDSAAFYRYLGKGDRPEPVVHVTEYSEGEVASGDGWTCTALEVKHAQPWLNCYGFRFETDEGVVAFSGDTAPCDAVVKLARDADLVVIEAVHREERIETLPSRNSETGTTSAGRMAKDAGAKRLVINHQSYSLESPDEAAAGISDVQEAFGGPVYWGKDGMVVGW